MMRQNQSFEVFIKNMGIYFSGGHIGMAQQRLDHPQIGTACQQMRGKGMAQGMRADKAGL